MWKKRRIGHPDPPSDGELIAYLDGELTSERRRVVRGLLEASWELRARLADIEADTKCYVDASADELAGRFPSSSDVWARMRASQAQASTATISELPQTRSRFLNWTSILRPAYSWSLSLGAAAVLIGVFIATRPPTVSAAELLDRGHAMEATAMGTLQSPVLHQTLLARKGASTASWQVWRAPGQARYAERVAGEQATVLELKSILEMNHMDSRRPLSAAVFREWHSRVSVRNEKVTGTKTAKGEKAYEIEMRIAGDPQEKSILASRMVMRERDWHPVVQQFTVHTSKGEESFEISETSSEVLPFAQVAASVFADGATAPAGVPPSLPSGEIQTSSSLSQPLPTQAQLFSTEVKVLYALHRMQACSGEGIAIETSARGVRVHGLAETSERKRELMAALGDIKDRLISIDLRVPDDAAGLLPSHLPEAVTATVPEPGATAAGGALPIEALIPRRPDGSAALASLSNEAIVSGRSLLMEAWAVRRLFDRYAELSGAIDPGDRWLLETIARDHLQAVEQRRRRISDILRGLVPPSSPDAIATAVTSNTQTTDARTMSRNLVEEAGRSNSLLLALFARGSGDTVGKDGLTRLATGLAELESQTARLSTLLDRSPGGASAGHRAKPADSR